MENAFYTCNGDFQSDTENKEGKDAVGNILPVGTQLFYNFFGMAVEEKYQSAHKKNGKNNSGSIDEVIFPVFVCTVCTQRKKY